MTVSDTTKKYANKLDEMETNKPAEYQSQYGQNIGSIMDKIVNRKFSYDFNADPLYQQYKDQYSKAGNEASMNAVANASALTGGYGNSYAATAGAQANQQYMTQLNNMIPELAEAAQARYDSETKELYNQYDMFQNAENDAYNKYRDQVNDYNTDRNYYQNALSNSQANDKWSDEFGETQKQNALDNEYRNKVFEWDKYMDAENLQMQKDQITFNNEMQQKEFDQRVNEFWTSFNENVRQYDLGYAIDQAQLQLQKEAQAFSQNMSTEQLKLQQAAAQNQSYGNKDYSKQATTLAGVIDRDSGNALGRDAIDTLRGMAPKVGEEGVIQILSSLVDNGLISENDQAKLYHKVFNEKWW